MLNLNRACSVIMFHSGLHRDFRKLLTLTLSTMSMRLCLKLPSETKSTCIFIDSQRPRQQLGYLADVFQGWHLTFSRAATQRRSEDTMTSASAGHIILTPTQPEATDRPEFGSTPRPPDPESRALPTELPRSTMVRAADLTTKSLSLSPEPAKQMVHCFILL